MISGQQCGTNVNVALTGHKSNMANTRANQGAPGLECVIIAASYYRKIVTKITTETMNILQNLGTLNSTTKGLSTNAL